MLFNSFSFLVFLPIVFFLYWFVVNKKLHLQNGLLLVASFFFYACWDYRFLFLLIFSTILGYYTGAKLFEAKTENGKKSWLLLSVFVNLGVLCFFKYFNFFSVSFASFLSGFGLKIHPFTYQIILPLGISFYTFHGLSYVMDIYYNKIQPEKNFIRYAVFVSFFPLLVAGPIERAGHMLPQIQTKRAFQFSMAADGLKQMLWGFFKKVVIADNCALYVNMIFTHADNYSGSTHFLAAIIFSIQMYCDFSGYSDIALGTARLFGIELLRNFAFPFFAKDIAEFWRSWHISLTSLATEYIFTPLSIAFRNFGKWGLGLAIIINFVIIGIWHGANWTFVLFGLLHGCYFIPLIITGKLNVNKKKTQTSTFVDFLKMLGTGILVALTLIVFRSESVSFAVKYFSKIFSSSFFTVPVYPFIPVVLGLFLFVVEWQGKKGQYGIQFLFNKSSRFIRWSFYYVLLFFIHKYFDTGLSFIYFQF